MNIDVKEFSKECSCGKTHNIFVKDILIEENAIERIPELLKSESYHCYQSPLIICDDNTYLVAGKRASELVKGSKLLVLDSTDLHADNRSVDTILEKMPEDIDLLFAVGSGTIHDLTRYVAFKMNISFISIPTAASVDGFVSTVAAMTWNGLKVTLPAVSPICVIADSNIFAKAPYRLTASGISDLLGKYTALADWKIAHLLTGEYICERVYELELMAVNKVCECVDDLKNGKLEAYNQLMYALLISGLAMQMVGNSRPASGAEHHISHLWEMEVLNQSIDAYHGEKVSIGLLISTEIYHNLATFIHNGSVKTKNYEGIEMKELEDAFSKKGLLDGILKENDPDPLANISLPELDSKLEDIANLLDELPSTLRIQHILTYAGCVMRMKEVGLTKDILEQTIKLSPYVRNRLTFMRLIKLLNVTEKELLQSISI